MPDRVQTVKALQKIHTHFRVKYRGCGIKAEKAKYQEMLSATADAISLLKEQDTDCKTCLMIDALAALKEQEAVELVESSIPGVLLCGACKCSVMREEGYRFRHCPWCGKKVKWE